MCVCMGEGEIGEVNNLHGKVLFGEGAKIFTIYMKCLILPFICSKWGKHPLTETCSSDFYNF